MGDTRCIVSISTPLPKGYRHVFKAGARMGNMRRRLLTGKGTAVMSSVAENLEVIRSADRAWNARDWSTLVEKIFYYDSLSVMTQLGLVQILGGGARAA